ncbi:hypothetical protein [Streptomyces sp. bgisy027]
MRMKVTKAACWFSGALLCVAASPAVASATSAAAAARVAADPAYKVL